MARDKKFVFRLSDDESNRLAQLAMLSHRTQSDVIRCLLRTANTQIKNPSVARSLAAHATGGVNSTQTNEVNDVEFTRTFAN